MNRTSRATKNINLFKLPKLGLFYNTTFLIVCTMFYTCCLSINNIHRLENKQNHKGITDKKENLHHIYISFIAVSWCIRPFYSQQYYYSIYLVILSYSVLRVHSNIFIMMS